MNEHTQVTADVAGGNRLFYVYLHEALVDHTATVCESPLINVDYAADGRPIGVEICA